jgi:hypothetical protein
MRLALSMLRCSATGPLTGPCRRWDEALLGTVCGPEGLQVQAEPAAFRAKTAQREGRLPMAPSEENHPLVQNVSVAGAWTDSLSIA